MQAPQLRHGQEQEEHDLSLIHILTYSGGDALLKPSEQGLSALVSNVLTKGTAKRSATEMQAFLADRAAGLAASAGRKTFSVNLTTPARFNKDLFDLLGEVVTAPAFSKDETARGIKDPVSYTHLVPLSCRRALLPRQIQ